MVRVTLGGDDLTRLPARGFDQWFRLFLPNPGGETDFAAVLEGFGMTSYLRYLASKSGTRPPFRNYTVRELLGGAGEVDVDFVPHENSGIAGPWARRAEPGDQVAFIDQGRRFDPIGGDAAVLLVGDGSALPAIAGVLRDLPRDATGLAPIEIPRVEDAQALDAPPGIEVRFLARPSADGRPGVLALGAVIAHMPPTPRMFHAYLAGEQALVVGARRHLVAAGVPKSRIAFTGYWKAGRAAWPTGGGHPWHRCPVTGSLILGSACTTSHSGHGVIAEPCPECVSRFAFSRDLRPRYTEAWSGVDSGRDSRGNLADGAEPLPEESRRVLAEEKM